jgi:hypothetical protein
MVNYQGTKVAELQRQGAGRRILAEALKTGTLQVPATEAHPDIAEGALGLVNRLLAGADRELGLPGPSDRNPTL